jgi:hypothetical protein
MDDHYNEYIKNTHIPSDFSILEEDKFDPAVWGPHYWFFLHTVSHTYPLYPNSVTKRKYYDLIQNMALFIPNEKIGNDYNKLLDNYPVTPYLANRDSFIRWVHFIHNRINKLLDKEEITLFEALDNYRSLYKSKQVKLSEKYNIRKEYILGSFTIICIIFIIYLYND